MNAADALTLAHAAGVRVRTDGDDLVLEASAPPPAAVLDLLSRHKADIMTMLRSPAPEHATGSRTDSATAVSGEREHAGPGGGRMPHKPHWLVCTYVARGRPPSWADPAALPSRGCFCTCCKGQRWWRECEAPKGWRCSTCHPPDHLPPDAVTEMRT